MIIQTNHGTIDSDIYDVSEEVVMKIYECKGDPEKIKEVINNSENPKNTFMLVCEIFGLFEKEDNSDYLEINGRQYDLNKYGGISKEEALNMLNNFNETRDLDTAVSTVSSEYQKGAKQLLLNALASLTEDIKQTSSLPEGFEVLDDGSVKLTIVGMHEIGEPMEYGWDLTGLLAQVLNVDFDLASEIKEDPEACYKKLMGYDLGDKGNLMATYLKDLWVAIKKYCDILGKIFKVDEYYKKYIHEEFLDQVTTPLVFSKGDTYSINDLMDFFEVFTALDNIIYKLPIEMDLLADKDKYREILSDSNGQKETRCEEICTCIKDGYNRPTQFPGRLAYLGVQAADACQFVLDIFNALYKTNIKYNDNLNKWIKDNDIKGFNLDYEK